MTTREERVRLAREVIVGSGARAVIMTGLRNMAESLEIEPSEVFGDLGTLADLWLTETSEAWSDIFTAEHMEALIAWNATDAATEMREKHSTVQALGERIMERCIDRWHDLPDGTTIDRDPEVEADHAVETYRERLPSGDAPPQEPADVVRAMVREHGRTKVEEWARGAHPPRAEEPSERPTCSMACDNYASGAWQTGVLLCAFHLAAKALGHCSMAQRVDILSDYPTSCAEASRPPGGAEPPNKPPDSIAVFSPRLGDDVGEGASDAIAYAPTSYGFTYYEANGSRVRVLDGHTHETLMDSWRRQFESDAKRETVGASEGAAPPPQPEANPLAWALEMAVAELNSHHRDASYRTPAYQIARAEAALAAARRPPVGNTVTEMVTSITTAFDPVACVNAEAAKHREERSGWNWRERPTADVPSAPPSEPDPSEWRVRMGAAEPATRDHDSHRHVTLEVRWPIDGDTSTMTDAEYERVKGQSVAELADALTVNLGARSRWLTDHATRGTTEPPATEPKPANVIDHMDISVKVAGVECGRPVSGAPVEVRPEPSQTPDAPGWSLHRLYSVARTRADTSEERYGQALFNTLREVRPDIAEGLRGTTADPFQVRSTSDERMKRAIEAIESQWGGRCTRGAAPGEALTGDAARGNAPGWPEHPPPGWKASESQSIRKPWTCSQIGDCTHTYETEQGAIDAAWEMATEDARGSWGAQIHAKRPDILAEVAAWSPSTGEGLVHELIITTKDRRELLAWGGAHAPDDGRLAGAERDRDSAAEGFARVNGELDGLRERVETVLRECASGISFIADRKRKDPGSVAEQEALEWASARLRAALGGWVVTPEHMAKAHAMLDCAADGPIAVAELLATQLAEVARLTRELANERLRGDGYKAQAQAQCKRADERTRELADAHRDLAIVYGRNECGQRFPSRGAQVAAARGVAHRNGWADPYPEEPQP